MTLGDVAAGDANSMAAAARTCPVRRSSHDRRACLADRRGYVRRLIRQHVRTITPARNIRSTATRTWWRRPRCVVRLLRKSTHVLRQRGFSYYGRKGVRA